MNETWGPQTIATLDALGQVADGIKVVLEMRWQEDCTRFEREYCAEGRWQVTEKHDFPRDVVGLNPEWERTVYQLH